MITISDLCRSHARRVAAAGVVAGMYLIVAPAPADPAHRNALARRFTFTSRPLASPTADRTRTLRDVHPSYRHIEAWISSVGAAAAVGDFDGDGIDNDVCLVDPRARDAVVMPVPGTGARYAPHALAPAGVDDTIAPMGCLLTDLDEDGHVDALVYYWGRAPAGFLNRGDDVRAFDVAPAERWFSNAGLVADVDGDGHLDVVIGNYFPDGSRVLDSAATDAAVMQDSMSRAYNGGTKRVLLWQRAEADRVVYRDADPKLPPEVRTGWTLALGARDLDGDLRPELYIANDFGPDRLLHNLSTPGSLRFELVEGVRHATTPRSKVLGRDSFKGMGVDFGDIDRDGDDDIAVSNIAAPFALLESNFLFVDTRGPNEPLRDGVYEDHSEPLGVSRGGWAWDIRFADFDADGWLEIVQANGFVKGHTNRWADLQELATGNDGLLAHPAAWPHFRAGDDLSGDQRNRFFARDGKTPFVDIAEDLQLPVDVTRGLATADIDGDCDLDLVVANQWEDSQVLVNEAAQGTAVCLRLVMGSGPSTFVRGVRAGSPAVGARAVVHLADGRRVSAQLDGGSGHSGKSAPLVHFGFGKDTGPFDVEIAYRTRRGVVAHARGTVTAGTWTVVLGDVE